MTEASQVREEMGLVDTLNGIIAAVSKKLFDRYGKPKGFKSGEFIDGIHTLSIIPEFSDYFMDVDFRNMGNDRWYSSALEDFLFLGGAWGGYDFVDWGQIYLYPKRCEKRIENFRKKFGDDAINLLEQMADELIARTPRYSQIAV